MIQQKTFQSAISQKVKVSDFPILHLSKKLNKLKEFECPVLLEHNNVLKNPVNIIFKNKVKCILFDGNLPEMILTTKFTETPKKDSMNLCIQHNSKLNKSILVLIDF